MMLLLGLEVVCLSLAASPDHLYCHAQCENVTPLASLEDDSTGLVSSDRRQKGIGVYSSRI